MRFLKLVNVFEELEQITSGNKIRKILAGFFKKVNAEIVSIAYMTLGKIDAEHKNTDLGLADTMVRRA